MGKGNIYIIPDVHGRTFWKDVINVDLSDSMVVFLGDYMDPYPWEEITNETALDNFREIIAFAAQHQDKVKLLLGNHDLQYISGKFRRICGGGSRFCYALSDEISAIYETSKELFSLCWSIQVNGLEVLMSHAGVSNAWQAKYWGWASRPDVDVLNHLLKEPKGIYKLADVDFLRGGRSDVASMVWCDVMEFSLAPGYDDIYQIFGHTQRRYGPLIRKNYADLDCRRVFSLNIEKGELLDPATGYVATLGETEYPEYHSEEEEG